MNETLTKLYLGDNQLGDATKQALRDVAAKRIYSICSLGTKQQTRYKAARSSRGQAVGFDLGGDVCTCRVL